jgi:isoleucyl-tRNA synthetase
VLHVVVERLAGLIAPVLCHMAEDIWQHIPYPVAERSVFERGWPTMPTEWQQAAAVVKGSDAEVVAMRQVLELRNQVNRLLEGCRSRGALGASLEARVQLQLTEGQTADALRSALQTLSATGQPTVDNLADWLLVSTVEVGSDPLDSVLAEASEDGLTLRIARAEGSKCERCWHYSTDIGHHHSHPTLCGRCVGVLEPPAPGLV